MDGDLDTGQIGPFPRQRVSGSTPHGHEDVLYVIRGIEPTGCAKFRSPTGSSRSLLSTEPIGRDGNRLQTFWRFIS